MYNFYHVFGIEEWIVYGNDLNFRSFQASTTNKSTNTSKPTNINNTKIFNLPLTIVFNCLQLKITLKRYQSRTHVSLTHWCQIWPSFWWVFLTWKLTFFLRIEKYIYKTVAKYCIVQDWLRMMLYKW